MIDALDMLLGAGLLAIGYIVGHIRRKPRQALAKEPEAICGCRHHYSFHGEDGECQGKVERWDSNDETYWETCTCKRYTGPEPLPTYIP